MEPIGIIIGLVILGVVGVAVYFKFVKKQDPKDVVEDAIGDVDDEDESSDNEPHPPKEPKGDSVV